MKTINSSIINNGTIELDMKVFIIPNSLKACDDIIKEYRDRYRDSMTFVMEAAGGMFDADNDLMVQLWYHGDMTDNLKDHGIYVKGEGDKMMYLRLPNPYQFLPVKLFEGKNDGDIVDVTLPAIIQEVNDKEKIDHEVVLKLHLTLDQLHYRYRSFGDFRTLLNKLIESYNARKEKVVNC